MKGLNVTSERKLNMAMIEFNIWFTVSSRYFKLSIRRAFCCEGSALRHNEGACYEDRLFSQYPVGHSVQVSFVFWCVFFLSVF